MSKSTPMNNINFNESETVEFKSSFSEMLQIVHWSGTTKNDPTGKYSLLIQDSALQELLAE